MPVSVAELDTPAVVIDLDIVEANIRRAQDTLSRHGLANRPHIKTHKIPALAKMQIDAGAIGITCQKLGEVEVMADAGVADDILLTYNVLGEAKTERLVALIRRLKRMAVVVDNEVVARGLSSAAKRHGVDIRFLIECDTGGARNGVQSPQAALDFAQAAMRLPNMRFEGLMTYPTAKPEQRLWLERALQLLNGAGIATPVVSGGGSPALKGCGDFPMLTEYRAGTYIYNDVMQVTAGAATWDDCAMTVRATVVSRPTEDRAVFDAGSKVMTYEQYYAKGFGRVVEYPDAQVTGFSEEHGILDLSACQKKPRIGETISVIPNHCCVVTNMMDEVYAARGGVVEAVYPVAARGEGAVARRHMQSGRALILEDLAARIASVFLHRPVRIAVDGRLASGKTMLSDEVATLVRRAGRDVIRTSIDGFHRSKAERYARGRHSAEGYYYDSRDLAAVMALLLAPLGPGGDRVYRTASFDLEHDRPIDQPAQLASADAVLIVDGTFLQRPELREGWDVAIFIDTAEDVAERRGIGRDTPLLGGEDAARRLYAERYRPAFDLYDGLCAPKTIADVVVQNDDLDHPHVHIRPDGRLRRPIPHA